MEFSCLWIVSTCCFEKVWVQGFRVIRYCCHDGGDCIKISDARGELDADGGRRI